MKSATPTLLLILLGATKACHAFVVAPRRVTTTTFLASETPTATSVSKEKNNPNKHQLQPVFPLYAKPDPKGLLGKLGDMPGDKKTQIDPSLSHLYQA